MLIMTDFSGDNPKEILARLNDGFCHYLRELKKKGAEKSIFLLVDSFISIAQTFGVSTEEYDYMLAKYQEAQTNPSDMNPNEIEAKLFDIIKQFEGIYHVPFALAKIQKPIAANAQNYQSDVSLTRFIDLQAGSGKSGQNQNTGNKILSLKDLALSPKVPFVSDKVNIPKPANEISNAKKENP
jgi:hypothetical protein